MEPRVNPGVFLQEFSNQAASFCLNLNGTIDLDRLPAFRGGTAAVHRGTCCQNGSLVAVKKMFTNMTDVQTIKRVLWEMHVWSKLYHENVLALMGTTTDFDDTVSLVSQWMEKGNAHDYVQDKAIDPRPLIVDIAHGLCYLHNHPKGQIIHGDLKGQNVLISDRGRALLADFGYTRMTHTSLNITVSSPKGCTPNWASPEIMKGECSSAESDVWAFGMTALELFTRKAPFAHLGIVAVFAKILTGSLPERPSKDSTYSRMTDDWWGVCLECWKQDPSSRPSALQFLLKVETMVHAPFFRESRPSPDCSSI
ncbi:hypothetical protein ID866_7793 [Astraeus odoratus]|nr:hypothetical protein ID866_7793 [Astraeus odoratus]